MGIFSMIMLNESKGADLDKFGLMYGVSRLENENDYEYRKRIFNAWDNDETIDFKEEG